MNSELIRIGDTSKNANQNTCRGCETTSKAVNDIMVEFSPEYGANPSESRSQCVDPCSMCHSEQFEIDGRSNSMNSQDDYSHVRVMAIIATVSSREGVLDRAIRSVNAQIRKPDVLIVVVDLPRECTSTRTLRDRHAEADTYVEHLRLKYEDNILVRKNERTPNVSGTGCWNSGIMLALALEIDHHEYVASTCNTFVAILDDDDEWMPEHVRSCLEASKNSDWIVSGLIRDSGERQSKEIATRDTLHVRDFLIGNPGVQGSNMFLRLPLVLRAGMFDEAMNSMTDRDLCIRLIDDLGTDLETRVAFTGKCTVVHHADPIDVRSRVTTDQPAKKIAIQKFLWRYGHRFSPADFEDFCSRAHSKFQIKVQSPSKVPIEPFRFSHPTTMCGDHVALPSHALHHLSRDPFLPCGVPTESSLQGLFGIISSDIRRLQPLLRDIVSLPKHINASVLVFANTSDSTRLTEILECTLQFTGISMMVIATHDEDVNRIVSDYSRACDLAASPVPPFDIGIARTVLQMRMHEILLKHKDIEFAMVLDDDKRLPRDSFLSASYVFDLDRNHIYIGQDCKTAPNTLANGLRTQLRDLVFALDRAAVPSDADAPLFHAPTNAGTMCEINPHDAYYDLSTSRFDHLEEPQLPAHLENLKDRVLRGDPLARVALPQTTEAQTVQRGGCMLMFRKNFGSLECPQVLPEIRGVDGERMLSRRSDSVWLAVQHQKISCMVLPALFVLHENHFDAVPSPTKVRCNALAEAFGSALCRPTQNRSSYLNRRICSMLSNNERTRGLSSLLRRNNSDLEMQTLADDIDAMLDEAAWNREVFQPLAANALLLENWSAMNCIKRWEAKVYLRDQLGVTQIHELVGAGCEGVVFRHSSKAFKIFEGNFPEKSIELLQDKGILDCKRESTMAISYSFVSGKSYRGEHGKKLVEMLHRLKNLSVVMTNIKPDNLVVNDAAVEIVDLGRDWVEYSPTLWKSMCRRAFLSWRFGKHSDTIEGAQCLKLLMTRERTEVFFPELTGFDIFFQLCEHGFSPFLDPNRFEKVQFAALEPIPRLVSNRYTCTLLIKSCLMEAKTIVANVRHLVWRLRRSGTIFEEVVLSVDRVKRDMLRPYADIDESAFDEALKLIQEEKLIDVVHNFDENASEWRRDLRELNRKYFDVGDSLATHSESGESHAALLSSLETIKTDLVLQVDADICLNIHQPEDLVSRAARIFDLDPKAVTTLALPIYCKEPQAGIDFVDAHQKPFRFEIRFSFIHLRRFRNILPLLVPAENVSENPGHILKNVGWYRILDVNVQKAGLRSYRFFSPCGFWLHPKNECKKSPGEYMHLADRICSADVVRQLPSSGVLTPSQEAWVAQDSKVDVLSSKQTDYFGERAEKLVFVCCGRNLPYGRALRCLESLSNQRGANNVGVIVIDDASAECPGALFEASRCLFPGRVTNIHTGIHRGFLQNTSHAIKRVCINSESVIVTLDLDDFLFQQPEADPSVVERIRDCFFETGQEWAGRPTKYLVALGGMVRETKMKHYPLHDLGRVRGTIAAGNIWKHVRCFKKHLFDTIPDEHFHLDLQGQWISHGADWAFMVPIVEQAGQDRIFEFPPDLSLYFYEDGSSHQDTRALKHLALERVAVFLKSLPSFPRFSASPASAALVASCSLPSNLVGDPVPQLRTYEQNSDGVQSRVLIVGDVSGAENVPVRIHSECFSGDVFGSQRCDCGPQKDAFLKLMGESKCAVMVYISGHEGRGNGWNNKAREYGQADLFPDLDHNEILCSLPGCVSDCRDYGDAVMTLSQLGMRSVCLHTNNPAKEAALKRVFDPALVSVKPVPADMTNPHSLKYLLEKVHNLGHNNGLVVPSLELLNVEVRRMLENAPFQNLSLLVDHKNTPTEDLGLCFDRNVTLCSQLEKHGFLHARVVGARTRCFDESEESSLNPERAVPLPFNHVVLLVNLASQDYLVDVGNNAPYFMPLALPKVVGSSSLIGKHHSFLQYCIQMISDQPKTFVMQHNRPTEGDWRINYTFCQEDTLSTDDIANIVTAHANDPSFGHMLYSLRISKWSLHGTSAILRNCSARVVYPTGKVEFSEICTWSELVAFIQKHFGESIGLKLDKAAPVLLENLRMKNPPSGLLRLLEAIPSPSVEHQHQPSKHTRQHHTERQALG